MENIIRKVFLYLLMACTFIAASFICVTRLFVTVDFPINMDSNYVSCLYYFFDFPSIIFGLILLAISLFLFYKLKIHEYVKTIHIEIFIFLWVCIVGILTKELFKMQAFEDGYFILYAANAFLDGGKEVFINGYGDYFARFPYQIGFLSFVTIIGLFTDNIVETIQILQIIVFAIACVLFSKIIKSNKKKLIYFLLLILFYTPIAMCCYFYGFSLGLSFAMISIYFLHKSLNSKSFIYLIATFTFLFLSILFKTNFNLLAIAFAILFLLENKKIFAKLLLIVCCLITVFMANNVNSIVGKQIYGIDSRDKQSMLAYVVMGGIRTHEEVYNARDESLPGRFDGYVSGLLESKELIVDDLNSQLKHIIDNPIEALNFYWYKAISTFNSNDMNTKLYLASNNSVPINENRFLSSLDGGTLSLLINLINNLFMFVYFIGMIFSIKFKDKESLLSKLIFVGGIAHVMLLETKPIYFYPWIMLSLPASINGLSLIGRMIYKNIIIEKKRLTLIIPIVGVCCVGFFYNLQLRPFETSLNQATLDKQDHYFVQKFEVNDNNISAIVSGYFGFINEDKINAQLFMNDEDITNEIEIKNDRNLREITIKKKDNSTFSVGDYKLTLIKEGQSSTTFGFLSNDENRVLKFYHEERKLFIYYNSSLPRDNVNEHVN